MNEQRIPGVRAVKRTPITTKTYALLVMAILAVFAVALLGVAHLPREDTVDSVSFDLATPSATSCVYIAGTQQTTIRTHLDSTTRDSSEVTLIAGVRNTNTEEVVVKATKVIHVRGHQEADYVFVVDVSKADHAHGATACFVEESANI